MSTSSLISVPDSVTNTPSTSTVTKKENKAEIIFKSVGHFFAKFLTEAAKAERPIETVEGVLSTDFPALSASVPTTQAAFAVLGDVAAAINSAGDAAKAKLSDAGLDQNVIAMVEKILADSKQVAALAKTL